MIRIIVCGMMLLPSISSAQNGNDIPTMYFMVGMVGKDTPEWVHVLQFYSGGGGCTLQEVTISPMLFYIDALSTSDGTISVTRIDEHRFKISYTGWQYEHSASSKFFVFEMGPGPSGSGEELVDIRGTATSLKDVDGKTHTDIYIPIKDETHYRTMTLVTPIPGIYPRKSNK